MASEFRLRDLAELQAWLEDAARHPLDGMPSPGTDPDPGTRQARLVAAYHAAAAWPPRLGSPEAAALLATPGGRAFFLVLCLREHQPGFGPLEALSLLPLVTPDEWHRLCRVAWGWTVREEILGELDPAVGPGDAKGTDWCEALNLVHEHRGMGYREMGELYLSQWRNLNAGGKPGRRKANRRPGETQERAEARVKATLDGKGTTTTGGTATGTGGA